MSIKKMEFCATRQIFSKTIKIDLMWWRMPFVLLNGPLLKWLNFSWTWVAPSRGGEFLLEKADVC